MIFNRIQNNRGVEMMEEKSKNILLEKLTDECIYCGGTGRTAEDPYHCRHCGAEYRPYIENIQQNSIIPKKYVEDFDIRRAITFVNNYILDKTMASKQREDMELLETILQEVKKGKVLNNSIYLSANKNLLEVYKLWLYNLIKYTELAGNTTSGIKFLNELDVDDQDTLNIINTVDWLIIQLNQYKVEEQLTKLDYILSKRAMQRLATITISNMPLIYLKKFNEYTLIDVDIDVSTVYPETHIKESIRYEDIK